MDDGRLAGTIADKIRVVLPGDAPASSPQAPQVSAAPVNLASVFTDQERSRIVNRAIEEFEQDVQDREEHMRGLKRCYELYAAVMKAKSWPFQNAANVNLPISTYGILQVQGRLIDMLLPAKGDYYHSVPTKADDAEALDRAERTETFVNWYLRENVPEYRMSYDATIFQLLIFGSTVRYFYWDYTENRLCTEWVSVEDFVVPYHCKVTDPSLRKVPRYTLVRHLSLFELQDRAESGEFDQAAVNSLGPTVVESKAKSELAEVVDEVDGKSRGARDFLEDEDRNVLEQHRWLRFPNDPSRGEAFDGKAHPVIVSIDETDRKLLRIVLREEDDPRDAKRFAKEQGAFQAYQSQKAAHDAMGGLVADPTTGELQPSAPPTPVPEPRKARKREVCFFTHYICFQGEGFYGLGLGHFLRGPNEAMNTIFNQQIDRGTVNNAGGGIISRQMRFQRGPIDRQPGKYVEVDVPPSSLKDGLQNWPQVAPDPEGRWFIQYLEQMSSRVSGAGDTLSGEPVGSNETARAAVNRYEQAQKQITVLAGRIVGYFSCDAKIIWRLFATYLDEDEYYEVTSAANQPLPAVRIGRSDFAGDAKVVPTADPRVASHSQRVGEAMEFMGTVTGPQSPPELSQNPALRRVAIEGYLHAAGRPDTIQLLGPPPGPPQPPQPKKQWEENAGFLNNQDAPVLPQDDDDMHLLEIQHFEGDPLGAAHLDVTGKKMLDAHKRAHLAQKMSKEKANHEREQAALSGPPGGGGNGMAQPPDLPALGGLPPA